MKKIYLKTVAVMLTLCLLFGVVPLSAFAVGDMTDTGYKVGDNIEFGSYPQSEVVDSAVIAKLEAEAEKTDWVSYEYYSGSGSFYDGKATQSDYMQYKDFFCDGEKYRAVRFTEYRPKCAWLSPSGDNSSQRDNFYFVGNTYYFKFEPLSWRVLDPSEGFIMCNSIVDSQAFLNFEYFDGMGCWYSDEECTIFATDWVNSSLRKWLNEDFYNTAFTPQEKVQIGMSYIEHSGTGVSEYSFDKIFILSYEDVKNSTYGFNRDAESFDFARQLKGTDYARCQGLIKQQDSEFSFWTTRSHYSSLDLITVSWSGGALADCECTQTNIGIVPAFKLIPQAVELSVNYDLDGGEWAADYSAPTSYMSNEKFTPPSNDSVKKVGYDFLGWKQSPVKRGVTALTAEWSVKDGYTVSFDPDGGSETADKTNVKWTDKVLDGVNNPEKDGYTFSCWKYDETQVGSDMTYADLARDDTLMSVTLKSVYTPNTYIATLLVDGEVYREIPYTYGQKTVTLPEVPQKEGFAGEWESYSLGIGGAVINAIYTALPKNVRSVSINDMSLTWKQTGQLAPKISADDGAVYTVSYGTSDPKIATVDKNGKVTAVDKGTATVTCTVTDSNGNTVTDTCKITVTYAWWQWIVKILLFGWIWY